MERRHIFLLCILTLLGVASCEKFFDRAPEDKFDSSKFFQSESDLVMYANGLINTGMPGAESITEGEDLYTDLCGTRASKDFYYQDMWNPGRQSGWAYSNWGFLRQIAFMLENMPRVKGKISESLYNHYEGVARFWRAYATFNKVKAFGDCYFIDRVISQNDTTLLYGPRQSREYVMSKVKEDLIFACENCLAAGANINTDGRVYVNRYVAQAMASRIFLYEGTYRKYHPANPSTLQQWDGDYETAEDFLNLAFKYAEELIDGNGGEFSLTEDYRKIFTSAALVKEEVIWGRSYAAELDIKHNTTYSYCSTTSSQQYSPTKDYVLMFLKTDGTPAKGDVSVTTEFDGRDKRLSACVLGPGQKKQDQKGNYLDFAPNFNWTRTGYCWLKWVMTDYNAMNLSTGESTNSLPVLRYAEVLLNYAEAAEELGKMTPAIWNKTVGAIRLKHGGVTNIYPGDAGYVEDQFLREYYTKGLVYPVSLTATMLEIRRERVTELMLEGDSRFDDLMRWRMGDLITRRYEGKGWRGIYVTEEEAASGFTFNGSKYKVPSTTVGEKAYAITSAVDGGMTFSHGSYGYIIYHYSLSWEDKMYLRPIPTTALNVNPELGQNEGWQWI
jgi:hypothetical protein